MKQVAILLFLLLCGLPVRAQSDRLDSLLVDVLGNDRTINRLLDPPSVYLYSGITADNKTFYAGRELGDNMHTVNGNIYLMHSAGFYAGVSGTWYSDLDPAYNATVVTAGIIKPLNKKRNLSFRTSYSRYFYYETDSATNNILNNNIGVGLTLRNKWIGGRLSFNALFGDEFGMNLSPEVFSNITIARFGISGKLFLAPEASLFVGSETIEYESGGSSIDPSGTSYTTTDKYGILNTQIYLPLCIYVGDFDIEIGYSLNVPTTQDNTIKYPMSSFLSFSIGYLLPLN
jgi:hypothetical protein